MNKIVVTLIVSCLAFACVSDSYMVEAIVGEETAGFVAEEDETYTFVIEQHEPEQMSKSSFSHYESGMINDINIFVYHQGVLLKKYCRYIDDMSLVQMTLPGGKDGFNIYMVGNVGRLDAPENEEGIDELVYMAGSYEDFRTKGFPVANVFKGYLKGSQSRFAVKRLVGQYNLRVVQSAEDAVYTVRSVRMVNCALDMYPFSTNGKASVFMCENEGQAGDMLTEEDIETLNGGGSVSLFFVENMQGELLPGNTDPKLKIPSSLPDGVADRCTYIEVLVDVETPMAQYTGGRYRFYLGQNQTTDFSIKRNTVYSSVLNFTQNMVMEEDWRIEVDAPKPSEVVFEKEEAMVIAGVCDEIKVTAYDINGNIVDLDERYDVVALSGNKYVSVTKTANSLRFISEAPISGVYPFDSEPDYITEIVRVASKETYNGLPVFAKDIKVRVYDKLFPLLISVERQTPDAPYSVFVRGRNPMKLGLAVETSYTCIGGMVGKMSMTACCAEKNGLKVDNAVNFQGQYIGSMARDVWPTDLRRIDFVISGLGADYTGVGQGFPKLLKSAPLFPGKDTEATYGPFSNLYPARCAPLPADGKFVMKYLDSNRNEVVLYGPGSPEEGVERELTSWTQTRVYNPDAPDVYFYTDAVGTGVGKSKFVRNEDYSDCPFYVVNGGLTVKYFDVMLDKTLVRYPDKNSSHVEVMLYGSGRDLFPENINGDVIDNTHRMYFKVSRWMDQAGKVRVVEDAKYYMGLLYMTVNGASSWTGCDESEYGYFVGGK